MSIQKKIAQFAAIAVAYGHVTYISRNRSNVPANVHFNLGSQDQILADSLKTGDLIMFERDCTMYGCISAGLCAYRHFAQPETADHVGVVVVIKGEPYIFERTQTGVKLRLYDARINLSQSKRIILHRLTTPLKKDQEQALISAALPYMEGVVTDYKMSRLDMITQSVKGVPGGLSEVVDVIRDKTNNASRNHVLEFFSIISKSVQDKDDLLQPVTYQAALKYEAQKSARPHAGEQSLQFGGPELVRDLN